jgi:hypothetical protein
VCVAFQFLEDCEQPPPGYKKIPMHMVFDIKMDFTQNPPAFLTYLSVVLHEGACIPFLLAVLNGLEVIASDVGNAYLLLNHPLFHRSLLHSFCM